MDKIQADRQGFGGSTRILVQEFVGMSPSTIALLPRDSKIGPDADA